MAKTITTALQAANAGTGSWRVAGIAGLYLSVGETGARSWIYRYRIGDKRRYMGLGPLDRLSLSDARKKARELAIHRDEGRDPIEMRRREREANLVEARRKAPVNFRQATEAYFKDHAPSWRHKYSASTWRSPVVKYAFPVIGDMPLDDIHVEHIVAILRAAIANKAPVAGQKARDQGCVVRLEAARASGRALA